MLPGAAWASGQHGLKACLGFKGLKFAFLIAARNSQL